MDDRYSRYGGQGDYNRDHDDEPGRRGYGAGRDQGYASARDYGAGQDFDRGRSREFGSSDERSRDDRSDPYSSSFRLDRHRSADFERASNREDDRGGFSRDRDRDRNFGRQREQGFGGRDQRRDEQDRGFLDRAGDEVRSWFGDEDAMRRRERDTRETERHAGAHDDHYRQWRSSRIAELDRDYDEYRRENAQRFENEFSSWRTERQGQRDCLPRVTEHMDVVGSDGASIGTVDKVRGDRIILTKSDPAAEGHHHSIPSRWIQSVDDKVTLRKSAEEAKAAWRDEERSGAFFAGQDRSRDESRARDDENGPHVLNRSFSGTY